MRTLTKMGNHILTIIILLIMVLFCFSSSDVVAAPVGNFLHEDINQYSSRYLQQVGPYDAVNTNKVTMWYHQYNRY